MEAISNAISAADSGPWQPTLSLFLPITSTSSRKSETHFRDVWLLSLVCFSPSKGLLSATCGILCRAEDRQTSPEMLGKWQRPEMPALCCYSADADVCEKSREHPGQGSEDLRVMSPLATVPSCGCSSSVKRG